MKEERVCPLCDGDGKFELGDGDYITCNACKGTGFVTVKVKDEKKIPVNLEVTDVKKHESNFDDLNTENKKEVDVPLTQEDFKVLKDYTDHIRNASKNMDEWGKIVATTSPSEEYVPDYEIKNGIKYYMIKERDKEILKDLLLNAFKNSTAYWYTTTVDDCLDLCLDLSINNSNSRFTLEDYRRVVQNILKMNLSDTLKKGDKDV